MDDPELPYLTIDLAWHVSLGAARTIITWWVDLSVTTIIFVYLPYFKTQVEKSRGTDKVGKCQEVLTWWIALDSHTLCKSELNFLWSLKDQNVPIFVPQDIPLLYLQPDSPPLTFCLAAISNSVNESLTIFFHDTMESDISVIII